MEKDLTAVATRHSNIWSYGIDPQYPEKEEEFAICKNIKKDIKKYINKPTL